MVDSPAMPFTVTDLIRSLRELLQFTKEFGGLVGDGKRGWRLRKSKTASRLLRLIGFSPLGSRELLERLAGGEGGQADLSELNRRLGLSSTKVNKALGEMEQYYEHVGEHHGLETQWQLEALVGTCLPGREFMGKQPLRAALERLAERDFASNPKLVQADAAELLEQIDLFNAQLLKLHAILAGPKKAAS
jgi:hypothetical protein